MRVRATYKLPKDKEEKLHRAQRLEWITIGFMLSIIAVIGFSASSSQAMKAAWIEDLLSLVPPISFLVAARFRNHPPDEQFPYGYRRAMSIAFLVAALALFAFGLFILFDSVAKLVLVEHTTIESVEIFGQHIWLGWLMIAALAYSIVPPVVLGHLKLPLATELHEKVLHADAQMNKADWMTGIAGIAGILGIAYGFWWADAVAAGIISLDIVKDGFSNLKCAVKDLMDERPTTVEHFRPDEITARLCDELEQFDWVQEAIVRLREEGDVLTGEAYVVPRAVEGDLLEKLKRATDHLHSLNWRLYDVVVVPVRSLSDVGGHAAR